MVSLKRKLFKNITSLNKVSSNEYTFIGRILRKLSTLLQERQLVLLVGGGVELHHSGARLYVNSLERQISKI
jgi:hypothetical protein